MEYYQKGDKFYTNKACTDELVLDNHTADQWAEFMFEIENCSECGRDRGDHLIIPFNGHWFALCKDPVFEIIRKKKNKESIVQKKNLHKLWVG